MFFRRRKKVKGPSKFGIYLASFSALVSSTLVVLMSLIAADVINLIDEYCTVEFYNDKEKTQLLYKTTVLEFREAEYKGPMPVDLDNTSSYPSIFYGWSLPVKHVFKDMKVYARFFNTGPLADFIDFFGGSALDLDLEDLDIPDTPIMTVTSSQPGPILLKQCSLVNYSNGEWKDAPNFKDMNKYFTNPDNFTSVIGGQNYPTFKVSIDYLMPFKTYPVPIYDTNVNNSSPSDNYLLKSVEDNHYETHSMLVDPVKVPQTLDLLKANKPTSEQQSQLNEYRRYANKSYRKVDRKAKKYVSKFVNDNGLNARDPSFIKKTIETLNAGRTWVPIKIPRAKGDLLDDFFNISREGDATSFATAATLIFREMGVPARYCRGYLGIVTSPNSPTPVSAQLRHYWCEVFVDSLGWVPVDCVSAENYMKAGGMSGMFEGKGGGKPGEANFFVNQVRNSKFYDGQQIDVNDFIVVADETKEKFDRKGLRIELKGKNMDNFINVGIHSVHLDIRLIDKKTNKDVTYQHNIVDNGKGFKITIKPRPITIETATETFKYDGLPHTTQNTISSNDIKNLLPGHKLTYKTESYTDIGEYDNEIIKDSVEIFEENNPSVKLTSNYAITFKLGKVIIY